jgi:uncharacterized damage-inducible protein DinB
MSDVLLEMFRHNTWATQRLLRFCRGLPAGHWTASLPGAYGSVLETFNHLVDSDAGYLRSLSGSAPDWTNDASEITDLGVLETRAEETAVMWERFLAEPPDSSRLLLLDKGTYEVNAGIVVAQALHHGNIHREQICAILTSLGEKPPDIQPWGFADETGRSRRNETENT